MCLPKREGGLGIKQLGTWNNYAIAKFIWRLHANTAEIWVTWAKMRLKEANLWTVPIPPGLCMDMAQDTGTEEYSEEFYGYKGRRWQIMSIVL